jgi:hypothetical protein
MIVAVFALVLAVLASAAQLVAAARAPRLADPVDHAVGLLEQRLRERFVVTMTSGASFAGLLEDVDDRVVVLIDAVAYKTDGTTAPADGQIVLHRDAIAYMQRP